MIVPTPSPREPRRPQTAAQPGAGVLLTRTALGSLYSAPQGRGNFNHAWRPFGQPQAVTFNLGTVQSLAGDGPLEPTIKGEPMSGKDGLAAIPLQLDSEVANDEGVSFAVLVVTPEEDGELRQESRIEIVHSLETISRSKAEGRKAIAQITWREDSVARIRPLIHFHLTYVRVLPSAGGGLPRHFFL